MNSFGEVKNCPLGGNNYLATCLLPGSTFSRRSVAFCFSGSLGTRRVTFRFVDWFIYFLNTLILILGYFWCNLKHFIDCLHMFGLNAVRERPISNVLGVRLAVHYLKWATKPGTYQIASSRTPSALTTLSRRSHPMALCSALASCVWSYLIFRPTLFSASSDNRSVDYLVRVCFEEKLAFSNSRDAS